VTHKTIIETKLIFETEISLVVGERDPKLSPANISLWKWLQIPPWN